MACTQPATLQSFHSLALPTFPAQGKPRDPTTATGRKVLVDPTAVDVCSGLMKPDTHLGENVRQIEVSDDQTTSSFSAEFKREAAALVLDQGYSHIEACRSLEVVESALRRWVNQLQHERSGVTPQTKALTPEQQKIQELEARIAPLEREKSILKKATALLSRKNTSARAH